MTHICVGELTIIGSDNDLSPGRRQADQCWNIINWTLGNKLQWNFNRNSNIFIYENALENVVCEMASILPRPQCVKLYVFRFLACDGNTWGDNCQRQCSCQDVHETCNHVDGSCQSGCRTGYEGTGCNVGEWTIWILGCGWWGRMGCGWGSISNHIHYIG